MKHDRLMQLASEQTPVLERNRVADLFIADVDSMGIRRVTAYECPNTSGDTYWWCPNYGYSVPEESLHEDANSARRFLIGKLRTKQAEIDAALRIAQRELDRSA